MDAKSLQMLEFPKIRDILAGFTGFSASRELAATIQPSDNAEVVQLWLRQSTEARQLLAREPGFSIGHPVDIRPAVAMAGRGKILDAETILDIRSTLASGSHLLHHIESLSDEILSLYEIARDITVLPEMEAEIDRCIEPGGEILDNASVRLAEIRYQLKDIRRQMMNRLENLLRSDWIQVMLQDSYITERGSRYVLPIKTEFQGEFKGIIHDISNTGATVFIEPLQTIDLGNSLRQLVLEEEIEIQRILAELSQDIAANSEDISRNVLLIAELDLALAKASYAIHADASEPRVIMDEESARRLKLINARHPLLKHNAVPISIEIGYGFAGLVITGPNTGGKTVSLKTMGLLALMAQSGIPIPAAPESEIAVFDNIFADIGDEQSIEETLSSFSWHVSNIVRIIRNSTDKSLVLLDELGTSTDPSEGAALARAILLHFLSRGILVVATTHFNELKIFAHATFGLDNAAMEFDPITLTPNFKITIGIPGGSNALAIASHLGIPSEIIASAQEMMPQRTSEMEKMLAELTSEREVIRARGEELSRELQTVEEMRRKAEAELSQIESSRKQLIIEERAAISREAAELHRQIRRATADLRKEQSKKSLEKASTVLEEVREQISTGIWQQQETMNSTRSEGPFGDIPDLSVGDMVRLTDTHIKGKVGALLEKTGQVEIHSGRTRIKADITDIERVEPEVTESVPGKFTIQRAGSDIRHSLELDLRGKRADEVEPELDLYLNDVSIAGFPEVRIIHGYGTGTVRQIVRDMLASHPLIKSFRSGKQEEGGDGVTIATL